MAPRQFRTAPVGSSKPPEKERKPARATKVSGEGGEVAAVDAFRQADFLGRKPLGHHADTDHEAGADDGEQQTGHHQLVEVLSGSKQQRESQGTGSRNK